MALQKRRRVVSPISSPIRVPIRAPIYSPFDSVGAGSGGGAFSPLDLASTIQFALNGSTPYYDPSSLGGLQVLRSLEAYDTFAQPRKGRCWLFDGVDDYGVSADNDAFDFGTGSWTYVTRIKPTDAGVYDVLFSKNTAYSTPTNGIRIFRGPANGLIVFWGNDSQFYSHSAAACAQGVWSTAAIGVNGSTAKVFSRTNGVTATESSVTVRDITNTSQVVLGATNTTGSYQYAGSMAYAAMYNVALTDSQIDEVHAGVLIPTGLTIANLVAYWPMNEESGLVGYDIGPNARHLTLTSITQSTFHATDTAITRNRNSEFGYKLSGSVHIPKRLSSSLAADGGALTVTGKSPLPITVETPCVTGDGSAVYAVLPDPGISGAASWSIKFTTKWVTRNTNANLVSIGTQGIASQVFGIGQGATNSTLFINAWSWESNYDVDVGVDFTSQFRIVEVIYNGTSASIYVDGVLKDTRSLTLSIVANNVYVLGRTGGFVGQYANASVADLQITTGGHTKTFLLQDGPGSANLNRNVAWYKSDGTYGVITNAIVNGTVANIWANRCPGYVQDHSLLYGGRIGAGGEFILGVPNTSLCADGNAKTLLPGYVGNPFSRVNFNPYTAAELNALGVETAYAKGTARQSVSPTDTKFRRTGTAGDDRFVIVNAAATGDDKTNLEAYVT